MRSTLACLCLLASSACGGAGPPDGVAFPVAPQDCFPAPPVSHYELVDSDTVRIQSGPDAAYEVDVSGPECRDIRWTDHAAFTGMASGWICVGRQTGQGAMEFRHPSAGRPVQCRIDAVRPVKDPSAARSAAGSF